MIPLTKFDGSKLWLNPDLIESIEAKPDTRVVLTTTTVVLVQEAPQFIAERVLDYRRAVAAEGASPDAAWRLIRGVGGS